MLPVAQPLSIPVHANQLGAVDEVCNAALGCSQSDVIGQLLLLVVTGLLAIVAIAVAAHVKQAQSAVSEERSRTATEREAFTRFAREIARLDASGAAVQLGPTQGATSAVAASPSPRGRGIEQVRAAYDQTILSMDHFEEEYDEPLSVHMGRELGEEVATAVEQNHQLTPPLKQALVDRAREAARDRDRLISRLDHELESLEAAHEELSAAAESVDEAAERTFEDWNFPELADEWNRLGELESRLSRLHSSRQEALQSSEKNGSGLDRPSLNEYLYDGLETSFPVLADAAELLDRVTSLRRRVLLTLTQRA